MTGHEGSVNAVKFFPTPSDVSILISGASDNLIRVWRSQENNTSNYVSVKTVYGHDNSVTTIATLPGSDMFASGSSDGSVRIWKLIHDESFTTVDVELVQKLTLSPRYFPLILALARLDAESIILAVAGTRPGIQIFTSRNSQFRLWETLTGHEGWIRALDFTRESPEGSGDLLLASASQDKYIRLWRIHQGSELPVASSALNDPALGGFVKSLSNKPYWIWSATLKYSITFEALLLGHEDWIYTASWRHRDGKLQLLSTSEDNSLAIWESDPASGVWVCITRLGEISAQKGSTSATGSAGGFWIGLWAPDGNSVVSLGRTGSWRKWTYSSEADMWTQQVAITGHVREVRGVAWSRDGSYLLSTSQDQTTRLFSEWKREGASSWHEFSRPQIHGYDLNCIDTISDSQFLTGADEKLLRVFDEPRGVANMLSKLCNIESKSTDNLPDAANIPVLGLSNKAIQAVGDDEPTEEGMEDERDGVDPTSIVRKSALEFSQPPFEDHLARHLLWPETEKLYGHGYEISAVAVSRDGSLVATACRASSIDHAVIRLYDTKEWLEVKPALKAHSLTVTSLQFSPDDKYLLSVGRDRQWVVWERSQEAGLYTLKHSNPKGHSRMILSCAWTPLEQPTFLTAGRDRSVKIWQITDTEVQRKCEIEVEASVTTVASCEKVIDGAVLFAFGTKTGSVWIKCMKVESPRDADVHKISTEISPAKIINQIVWRPGREGDQGQQIAVAADDSSVRVYNVAVRTGGVQ